MSNFITVAELRIEAERLFDENERLEKENAKLRELIEDIEEVADPMTFDFINARMRHIGIEVKS